MRWLPKRRDASSCLGALVRFSLFFLQHGPGGQHSASQQAMESGVRRASDDDVTPRTANNTGKNGRARHRPVSVSSLVDSCYCWSS